MDAKMPRTKSKDPDVAGSPRKMVRGNINHSTDPCNNVQVDVSVRKRRANGDGEMPVKRMRYNLTDYSERSQDNQIQSCKRKACVDAGPPQKKTRSGINTNPTKSQVVSPEDPGVGNKRKASDDGDAPEKKIRFSESTSITNNTSSDDNGDYVTALTEEEKIFEMSSSGNKSQADFEKKYQQLGRIGAGGFGSVYAGFRIADLLAVAIKHIPTKDVRYQQVKYNGKVYNIVLEVAFMLKAAGLPGPVGDSAAVSLLDWYILDQDLILVMERPAFSEDLHRYREASGGFLDETEAKMILRQLVDAAIDIHSKGVFHRDIKTRNVLVEGRSSEPRVRIIDFGCGDFSTEKSYTSYCGTFGIAPPEWFESGTYSACPTTVWQLGVLFYSLLNGHERFSTKAFINNSIKINSALSVEVKTLLHMCLALDPEERATLEDLQLCLAPRKPSTPPTQGHL